MKAMRWMVGLGALLCVTWSVSANGPGESESLLLPQANDITVYAEVKPGEDGGEYVAGGPYITEEFVRILPNGDVIVNGIVEANVDPADTYSITAQYSQGPTGEWSAALDIMNKTTSAPVYQGTHQVAGTGDLTEACASGAAVESLQAQ